LRTNSRGSSYITSPEKDNNATDFLTKLAARRDPFMSGVFINDLHEPSAHILEAPI
jgi:hypothetical protein